MHETAERLYAIAKAMKGVAGQSALASALNESPQTVNNWEARGVSVPGALKAQQAFACDANWLLTGRGTVLAGWPFSPALLGRVRKLPAVEVGLMEVAMWAHLRERPPEPVTLGTEPNPEDLALFTSSHGTKAKPVQRRRNS